VGRENDVVDVVKEHIVNMVDERSVS
jgi:hypothetical protein